METRGLETRKARDGVINCIVAIGGSKAEGKEVNKVAEIDLFAGTPFVMNAEEVVYQCFPMSEQEMIIISLEEEEELLAGEPLPTSPPSPSFTSLLPSMLSVPTLPLSTQLSTQAHNVAVVVCEGKCSSGKDAKDRTALTKLEKSTRRRKKCSGKQTKSAKEPHSQTRAPAFGDSTCSKETEEVPCDWLRCILCHEVLPSRDTLRHHFATAHSSVPITLHSVSLNLLLFAVYNYYCYGIASTITTTTTVASPH